MRAITILDERKQLDVSEAEAVQICVDRGKTVWVNVDGICLLRIQNAKRVEVEGTNVEIGIDENPESEKTV